MPATGQRAAKYANLAVECASMSVTELAAKYGVVPSAMSLLLKRRGLKAKRWTKPRESAPDEMACRECRVVKPMDEFVKRSSHPWGRDTRCTVCALAYNRARHLRVTLEKYGLTEEQYTALGESQGWACAMCIRNEPLVFDHCHTTGAFRGLLCHQCNKAIGLLRDDPATLLRGIQYLRRSSS